MKESEMWRRCAIRIEQELDLHLIWTFLCFDAEQHGKRAVERLELFRPSHGSEIGGVRYAWWKNEHESVGRLLAAWFLYYMALDDEDKKPEAR